MRVLSIYDIFADWGGGSQLSVLSWHENLLKMNVDSVLFLNSFSNASQNIRLNKIMRFKPNMSLTSFYSNYSLSFILSEKVKRQIKNLQPDIIHLHEPSLISRQIIDFAKKNQIKILVSYHTNYSLTRVSQFPLSLLFGKFGIINRLANFYQSSMMHKADCITAPSHVFERKLKNVYKKPVFYLPYPIPSFFFKVKSQETKKISKLITVSRLNAEKNIEVLIHMMSHLVPHCYLTIVGDGIDRSYFQKKVVELGLNQYIFFTGWLKRTELPEELVKHDLYVSASDFESFGISFVEALASGLPCIAYDYPVTRETIPKGTGVFVKDFSPKSFANVVTTLQQDPHMYLSLLKNIVKKRAEILSFREDVSTKSLLDIYRQIR